MRMGLRDWGWEKRDQVRSSKKELTPGPETSQTAKPF